MQLSNEVINLHFSVHTTCPRKKISLEPNFSYCGWILYFSPPVCEIEIKLRGHIISENPRGFKFSTYLMRISYGFHPLSLICLNNTINHLTQKSEWLVSISLLHCSGLKTEKRLRIGLSEQKLKKKLVHYDFSLWSKQC